MTNIQLALEFKHTAQKSQKSLAVAQIQAAHHKGLHKNQSWGTGQKVDSLRRHILPPALKYYSLLPSVPRFLWRHHRSNSSINQCCLKDTLGKTQARHRTRIGWGKEFNGSATNHCVNLLTDEFHYYRDMARKIIHNLGSNLWFYRSFGGERKEKENSGWR